MTNTPIIDKTKQKNDFNIIILIDRSLILLKAATKDKENQWIFTLKPLTNSFHY